MARIALVQPPHHLYEFHKDTLHHRYAVPLGLLALGAAIGARHTVTVINLNFASDARRFQRERYDVVGITCTAMNRDKVVRISRQAKKRGDALVVAGGPHPTLSPEDMLRCESIDYVVRGAGETVFPQLIDAHERKRSVDGIEGVCYRKNGSFHIGKIAVVEDLDTVPFPHYSSIDIEEYLRKNNGVVVYETSRGCMHKCVYCSMWKIYDLVYVKTTEKVLGEVERILSLSDNIRSIEFVDNTFNVSRKRVTDLCRGFAQLSKKMQRKVPWGATFRTDNIDEPIVGMMRDSGLIKAFVGFETASQKNLERLRRTQKVREMIGTVELFLKYGIMTRVSFQVGFPWESVEDMWETARLAVDLEKKGAFAMLARTIPLPGTDIEACFRVRGNRPAATRSRRFPYDMDYPGIPRKEIDTIIEYFKSEKKLSYIIMKLKGSGRSHPSWP